MRERQWYVESTCILIPDFAYPWPEAIHPDAVPVEQESLRWAAHHRLFPDEQYRARVERAKYGWLAARCYPCASRELLQVISDYFVWYFVVDDAFIDRVETVTQQTIPNLTAMIDVLDLRRPAPKPVFGETAWLDVCRRLRRLLPHEHFERFAIGMRMWAATAGLQILNHTRPESIGERQYETIRRHTSGMNPCLDLCDAAHSGPITAEEYHRPAVLQLRLHANNVVCWSNDIQSLAVETRQPGQYWNMAVIHARRGHTLQASVDYVAARVRAEIAAFQKLADQIGPTAGNRLRGFIAGLTHWMRGYQDWVTHDTERYLIHYADRDANDTGRKFTGR
jgi:hypothetical protein